MFIMSLYIYNCYRVIFKGIRVYAYSSALYGYRFYICHEVIFIIELYVKIVQIMLIRISYIMKFAFIGRL